MSERRRDREPSPKSVVGRTPKAIIEQSGLADRVLIEGELSESAAELFALLRAKRMSIATAESCTAGLVAMILSDAPGSAELLHGGFVTYTVANKICALGVPAHLIERYGAVSREVAMALASGALAHCPADLAIAITGVAGPEPDDRGNPVGLVYFAALHRNHTPLARERQFPNLGRSAIRLAAAREAIAFLTEVAAQA
jgi:nicotinamide-nucleotide amidase